MNRLALGTLAVASLSLLALAQTTPTISTFAGTGNAGPAGDGGLAAQADLNYPLRITTDANGNVYFNHDGRRWRGHPLPQRWHSRDPGEHWFG